MQIRRKEREAGTGMELCRQGQLVWLTFPALSRLGVVDHLFSTRLGGVSQGYLGSMNLGYARGDERERVDENFRRVGEILGRELGDFVLTDQTHTTNVRRVGPADRGKGITRARDYSDADGLVTDTPGLVLSAFFADCVPLYFVDPIRRAIGLSHSGWRGTVGKMGKVTVEAMTREFGSRPEEIVAAIGPSICGDCYEVGEDVAQQFERAFPGACGAARRASSDGEEKNAPLLRQKGGGKYMLDLWEANRRVLLEAGISPDHISLTDLCTCCNPDLLFSHRASHGRRGNLGAFLVLRDSLNPPAE